MRHGLVVHFFALTALAGFAPYSGSTMQRNVHMDAAESRISVGNASLHVRAIGNGKTVIVLHGRPDFDHSYLLQI